VQQRQTRRDIAQNDAFGGVYGLMTYR